MSWSKVESSIKVATEPVQIPGWLKDCRGTFPRHKSRKFAKREVSDILGCCTHHSGTTNQDPIKTAKYHISPNHVSDKGCPGLLYTFVISQDIEPDRVILANDISDITWSQGQSSKGKQDWSGDENRHLISILVMGDFDSTGRVGKSGSPTLSQIDRWRKLVDWLEEQFKFSSNGYFGHYHFGKRQCPGDRLKDQVESRRTTRMNKLLPTTLHWQKALLNWDPHCLPKYGADGSWGDESRKALSRFELAHKHKVDGTRDPFTELILYNKYHI